jgi:hypothetical protein
LKTPQVEAAFGGPRDKVAGALRRCLALRGAGVVGVTAQLATVPDRQLARLLAQTYRCPCPACALPLHLTCKGGLEGLGRG